MSFHNLNEEDFGSDDSNDEDYVPCDAGHQASEDEDSGEDESLSLNCDDEETADGKKKRGTKRKKISKKKSKKLKASEKEEVQQEELEKSEKGKPLEEASKEKANALWADFLKDVGGPVKSSNGVSVEKAIPVPKQEKVTVVKEYNFAGEIVRVPTEVDANSKEAKQEDEKQTTTTTTTTDSTPQRVASKASPSPLVTRTVPPKPTGSSGLSGLLDKLNKKPKMSILEKSKLDWTSFKDNEGISEELQQHNRGKNGYLERVAFLQRADLRQYEIERDIRLSSRKSL